MFAFTAVPLSSVLPLRAVLRWPYHHCVGKSSLRLRSRDNTAWRRHIIVTADVLFFLLFLRSSSYSTEICTRFLFMKARAIDLKLKHNVQNSLNLHSSIFDIWFMVRKLEIFEILAGHLRPWEISGRFGTAAVTAIRYLSDLQRGRRPRPTLYSAHSFFYLKNCTRWVENGPF